MHTPKTSDSHDQEAESNSESNFESLASKAGKCVITFDPTDHYTNALLLAKQVGSEGEKPENISLSSAQQNELYQQLWDAMGLIPSFLSNPLYIELTAVEAIHRQYQHGGGWYDMDGFKVDLCDGTMEYQGDPKLWPIAKFTRNNEVIWVYAHGWVTVLNTNGHRTARID